ncbi:MAG: hypothetical protein Fues2KO_21550 [Fuerstiella sp.]
MPNFEFQDLPQSFIDEFFAEELKAKVEDGGKGLVHEAMVLTGRYTFETAVVVSSWYREQLHRSWESTQISETMAEKLYTDQTEVILIYSQQRDEYHRFAVGGAKRRDGLARGAILGWRHILEAFNVIGLTPNNRHLVLVAKDETQCHPRAEDSAEEET